MKYTVFELIYTNIGSQGGYLLEEIPMIEWKRYKGENWDDCDDDYIPNSFENEEDFRKKVSFIKENYHDDKFYSNYNPSGNYVLLQKIKL